MLYLNNISIPVDTSFEVELSWVNPACRFDNIVGSAAVGIEIPVNEYTRAALGNPERFQKYSAASDRKFPGFEIRPAGVLLEAGTLIIYHADNEKYQGWLQSDLGALGEEQAEKFITDMAWKEGVVFQNKAEYNYQEDDYCKVRLKNERFWEGKGAHGNVIIPYINDDDEPAEREEFRNYLQDHFESRFEDFVNTETEIQDGDPDYARVVSPFLFFRYVLKEALRHNKFFIRHHPFDILPGMNRLVVYNNFNVFDPVPATIDKEFRTFNRRRNSYENVVHEVIDTVAWELKPFSYRDLVPKISLKDFLVSVQNLFNICFVFNPDRTVDIVSREAILSGTAIDLTDFQVGKWGKGDRKHVSLKFVVQYDKNDANFANKFHDLTDRYRDFREAVDTYDDLKFITSRRNPTPDRTLGQLRLVRSENKIYEFKWTTHKNEDANFTEEETNILGWEFVSSGPQYFVFRNGDEMEEIKTMISTLQMEEGILTARQQGNVNAMRALWSDFTLRLFYYLGGETGSVQNAADYVSLNWEGETGIFKTFWKNWASFWSERLPVEGNFYLPLNALLVVKNNITKKYRTDEGEFIIDNIKVRVGINRIGTTTVEAYKY